MTAATAEKQSPETRNPFPENGKAPERKPVPSTIQGMLQDKRCIAEIQRALPKHLDPDRLARIAMTEFRKTPALANCDARSFFGAVIQCAQLGLEPGNSLGHAYLLPFKNTKQNRTDVQFIIGYRGMIDLARRSGQIISLQAHVVHENDDFEFAYGLDEHLHHVPTRDVQNRGEVIAVYAVAKLKGGGHQIEVMWRSEVEVIRKQSKAATSGPWQSHWDEMAKKTVIRRLFKYLPVSVEMQRATILDELAESDLQDNRSYYDEATSEVFEGEYEVEPESAT